MEWQWEKRGSEKLDDLPKDTNVPAAEPTFPDINPELFPQTMPLLRILKPELSAGRRKESGKRVISKSREQPFSCCADSVTW